MVKGQGSTSFPDDGPFSRSGGVLKSDFLPPHSHRCVGGRGVKHGLAVNGQLRRFLPTCGQIAAVMAAGLHEKKW